MTDVQKNDDAFPRPEQAEASGWENSVEGLRREMGMLSKIRENPDVVLAGATARVTAYRNECNRYRSGTLATAKGVVYKRSDGSEAINPYLKVEREASAQMARIETAIRRELREAEATGELELPISRKSRLTVLRPEAQRILGDVPPRTFARLEAEGVIVPSKRGGPGLGSVYDLAVIVPAYLEHLKGMLGKNGDRDARARRDQAQAQFVELKILERKKQLLPLDEIERRWLGIASTIRNAVLSIPSGAKQRMPHLRPSDVHTLMEMVREILEELADHGRRNGDSAGSP